MIDGECDFHITDAAGASQRHLVLIAIEHKVKTYGPDGEASDRDPLEEGDFLINGALLVRIAFRDSHSTG